MGDTRTYIPGVHCCVCVQLGTYTAATATVLSERRDYQACDQHAQDITLRGLAAAIKHALRNPTKGAL